MKTAIHPTPDRYARCIENSRNVSWEIDRDVIRGRRFDLSDRFLPDGLSKVDELPFLEDGERRFLSQVQGRTYANLFGVVERYINAKVLELSLEHSLGDQVVLESLIRFSEEELKHQELFRRIEALAAEGMPAGYECVADPDEVARVVLERSTWAVLGLTCHIELFTLAHYRESIQADDGCSPLFKDVFLHHWKEESQHAVLDEMEWRRCDAASTDEERARGVEDLIALVGAVDGILQAQAQADTRYFVENCGRSLSPAEVDEVGACVLRAYRWQYIGSGVAGPFRDVLFDLIDEEQARQVGEALAPLL